MLQRHIGDIPFFVDTHSARDIYLPDSILKDNNLHQPITQHQILSVFSRSSYRPLLLSWELLDKCNFKCPFCYIVGRSHNKLIRFSSIESCLNEFIAEGLLYCTLTGGEALYHVDFPSIYRHLKSNGVFVEIYTNGYSVTSEILSLFKEFPPYAVEVSIYGLSDSVFRRNTGSNLSASVVLQNIIRLRDAGIELKCKTPLNTMTITEFEQIQNWCQSEQIHHYYSTEMTYGYDGNSTDAWALPLAQSAPYDAINVAQSDGIVCSSNDHIKTCYTCSVGKYGLYIDSAFRLLPCSSFAYKKTGVNITENGVQSAIAEMLSFVNPMLGAKILGCSGCSAYSTCKMCPALGRETIDKNGQLLGFSTYSEFCSKTRERHSLINNNT